MRSLAIIYMYNFTPDDLYMYRMLVVWCSITDIHVMLYLIYDCGIYICQFVIVWEQARDRHECMHIALRMRVFDCMSQEFKV